MKAPDRVVRLPLDTVRDQARLLLDELYAEHDATTLRPAAWWAGALSYTVESFLAATSEVES